ncbi:HEPN domain-containing protein [Vulcanisaeta distributa]|uniref:HEPN domain-containing protein n=1 Tax=Vulcanisaeta distributa TaxID=164451 RepID=UPI001FB49C11|nr:HEPN domain-containing protein [Vulcanisaeta distributa]
MSLDAAEDFMRRAEEYMVVARVSFERGGFYNAAAVNAEIAAQLSIKALLIKLGIEPPRTHNIRLLLGGLVANQLGGSAGEEVRAFVSSNRRELIILEDSRGGLGQYGMPSVDRDRAEIALGIAESIIGW